MKCIGESIKQGIAVSYLNKCPGRLEHDPLHNLDESKRIYRTVQDDTKCKYLWITSDTAPVDREV